ncbi:hypothetical protein [Thermanaeromonas toyohensis]|uniref:hypothetical protein n=1 Tax=Thermanaeromonas toyohensis TaxID=161154 RepID=UPI000A037589|nr:hypothetical protein [Thermanaeromonas toyohensis]
MQQYGFENANPDLLLQKIDYVVREIVRISTYLSPQVAFAVMVVCAVMLLLGGLFEGLKKLALAGLLFCIIGLIIVYAAPVLVGFVLGLLKR